MLMPAMYRNWDIIERGGSQRKPLNDTPRRPGKMARSGSGNEDYPSDACSPQWWRSPDLAVGFAAQSTPSLAVQMLAGDDILGT